MRPLTKVSVALMILIAVLLLIFAGMSQKLNRYLDQHPAIASCLKAGGTAEECKNAEEKAGEGSAVDGAASEGGTCEGETSEQLGE